MNTIRLTELTFHNWKNFKDLTINFNEKSTAIYGANEKGKTTIADGWFWLLTGKDTLDRKDYEIKNTKDKTLNRADHEVIGKLITGDFQSIELKRIFREKWVKKQGSKNTEFAGHETVFYYNDVPCSQSEYQKKINDIIPESVLKLLTNPLYFSSEGKAWSWKDRRNVLFNIAGEVTNEEVFESLADPSDKHRFLHLITAFHQNKTTDEYRKEIAAKKKKIKSELEAIPHRIDEAKRSIPESIDFQTVEVSINQYNKNIEEIDTLITDRSEAHKKQYEGIKDKQDELHKLKTRQNTVVYEVKSEIQKKSNDLKLKKDELEKRIESINADITSKTNLLNTKLETKKGLNLRTENLRALFKSTKEKELGEFDTDQFCCPTCKTEPISADLLKGVKMFVSGYEKNNRDEIDQAYELCIKDLKHKDDNIEAKKAEMLTNFQNEKIKSLEEINKKGQALTAEVKECDELIATLEKAEATLKDDLFIAKQELQNFEVNEANSLKTVDQVLSTHDEYLKLKHSIETLEASIVTPKEVDYSDLQAKKKEINTQLDALKIQLNKRSEIKRANDRINELTAQESDLSQELANLEGYEFSIDEFIKAKIDTIEAKINGMFEYVTFKMFDYQINGGVSETCEVMYNHVPFPAVNTAGKVWAGIDIINTLSRHFGVAAPIFLDNRESVTLIPDTECQVVSFYVSPEDKTLRVV